jgi:hydroxymethylglutaryl-CoA synthase
VLAATRDMFRRIDSLPSKFFRELSATFLHRPYQRMAETGLIMSYLLVLAIGDADDHVELEQYAAAAEVDTAELVLELTNEPDVFALVDEQKLSTELYPLATQTARQFRKTPRFRELMTTLGHAEMQEVGNLYTASLPAWMAAGFEEAWESGVDLGTRRILTIGYGSGDAAEVIPMRTVEGWEAAAGKIGFRAALAGPVDLDEASYHTLHDGGVLPAVTTDPSGVFYIERIGQREGQFDDYGIEYYRYQA